MLLAMDVGNTNIMIGVFDGASLKCNYRFSTKLDRTADEYGHMMVSFLSRDGIGDGDIADVIISSVVPPLTGTLRTIVKKYFNREPVFVESGIKIGMNIKYEDPREVGADRIVNAVAAYAMFGGPVIIVDFGTATTFCAVSKKGEYLGGAIAPGVQISVDALFHMAAKLSYVELKKPKRVIGKNTMESMQSGIYYGYVGLVDEVVRRFREDLGEDAKVIATGGLSPLISPESKTINETIPLLTLEGLRLIFEKNKGA